MLRQMQASQQGGGEALEGGELEDDLASAAATTATSVTSAGEGEDGSEASNPERRRLRRKLDELQEKKGRMEQLLGELQTLRQYRVTNGGCRPALPSSSSTLL